MAEAGGGEQRSMSWHCLAAGADGPVLTDPAETLGPCQKLRRCGASKNSCGTRKIVAGYFLQDPRKPPQRYFPGTGPVIRTKKLAISVGSIRKWTRTSHFFDFIQTMTNTY